ncbi:phosphatase PAP2 family protein [Aliivibrio sifiae]|uniref:undecaprenyl-diphosphate phosphatase n=1 Tax=Aliivibrio sifiae TaxID=566293 RepID=A0A2S7XED0_9GAMM|nr:phosphatase PAP2 family protein [Aliivibrio sifiae]PQJ89436.1 phospholipid phosphatase [Aliivibrio sifiae]
MLFSFLPKYRTYELAVFFLFILTMLIVLLIVPTPNLFDPLSNMGSKAVGWLSRSAGSPMFLLTSAIFCSIPIIKRLSIKKLCALYAQFAILLVLSLMLKIGVKAVTEIPRPYTQALVQVNLIDSTDSFYALKESNREALITQADKIVSPARIEQWKEGTNYSFPSGHTIFAAICVLFWGGFLLRHKHYILTAIVITWAVGVGFSRIWLGMHWPTDLIASMVSASILILCVPTIRFDKEPIADN